MTENATTVITPMVRQVRDAPRTASRALLSQSDGLLERKWQILRALLADDFDLQIVDDETALTRELLREQLSVRAADPPGFTGSDDFHLLESSVCIDAGTNDAPHLPATDLDGNPRVQDGDGNGSAVTDMGAYERDGPTLVRLADFSAARRINRVAVRWTTSAEIDNAGFNVLRSAAAAGAYTKINNALIAAEGSPAAGASYEFVDTDIQPGRSYYYLLEDVDLNGTVRSHGPVRSGQ